MVEIPDDAVEAAERALCNQHHAHPLTDEEWAMIRRELSDGTDQRVNARLAVEAAAPPITARVHAEAVANLCEALGEPVETPGDHPGEPSYRATWERALDVARGRTKVWLDLLQRAEVADADWLSEYRRTSATVQASVADRIAEAVAAERRRALNEAADEVHREQQTVRDHQALGFDPAGRLPILENLLRARARAAGSVPVATPEPTARDERPHSRACGLRQHEHGSACAVDCPTCVAGGGWHYPVATPPTHDHDFAPGVDVDMAREGRQPDPGWCNNCGESVPGPVATPTEPADEWGAPCSCIGDELGNHDPACDEGQRPIPNTEPPASPVPAKQPEPWLHESLALLEAERAEVAAVEAAAEQLDEQCAFEEQDDCPRHSPDASLRPVGQPEER